jgi:hypothetical protein
MTHTERRKVRITDIIQFALSVVTLMTVISAGFFWFYKTNALPERMDNAERRIAELEKHAIEQGTKTELIYQGILEIRSVLLRR